MVHLIRFFLGWVTYEVEGGFPERLVNLCGQGRVRFWDLVWRDETGFRFTVAWVHRRQVEELSRRAMCILTPLERGGVPPFLCRFRRRYALLAGLAACLVALAVGSRFIMTITVTGNQRVSTAEILAELDRLGVRVGAYGPAIEERAVANQALITLEELSFMAINLYGTRAEVIVREAEEAPALLDEQTPADVVAAASGIVTEVRTLAGEALVEPGDTVVAGETLIRGTIDLPEAEYSGADIGTLVVRARGEITARTWRTLEAQLPLTAAVKRYTGEEERLWRLTILGRQVNFYGNSGISFERYDKITQTHTLTLPGGWEMPLSVTAETARAYTLDQVPLDRDAAIDLLSQQLSDQLDDLLEPGEGTCVNKRFTAVDRDGVLTVTLTAECTEQIGRTAEWEGEVGHHPAAGESDPPA